MALFVLLVILAVIAFLIYWLHIPLPNEMDGRRQLQIIEPILRLLHEYPARIIELIFGPETRNRYTRWLFGLARAPKCPRTITISMDNYNGVPVRVYIPQQADSKGAIIYIHGGGFAIMNTRAYDGPIFALMKRLKMPVVSVEYRLAPEHKFPAGLDDCETAAVHLLESKYKELNVDPSKVVIMGDSAGGNLSAVVAQRLKRRTDIKNKLKLQVLIYPMIQCIDLHLPSYQLYHKKYNFTALLDPLSLARFVLLYLGIPATPTNVEKMTRNEHVTRHVKDKLPFANYLSHKKLPPSLRDVALYDPPQSTNADTKVCAYLEAKWEMLQKFSEQKQLSLGRRHEMRIIVSGLQLCAQLEPLMFNSDFSPIMAKDLNGLPGAMMITCGWDILRDEGILYAKRLEEEGVYVDWKNYPSAIHGAASFPSALRSRMFDDIHRFVQSNL